MTVPTPNSIVVRSVSYAAAARLVATTMDHAQAKEWRVCVAVCGSAGSAVAAAGRMAGVTATVLDFAVDKAFTAATSGKSTRAFYERMSRSTVLSVGLANRPRLITWEGGLPIVENEMVIVGIRVSGASGNEDAECVIMALATLMPEQQP